MQEAALIHRQKLVVQTAGTESDLETAFAGIAQQHAAALVVDADPFFTTRRDQLDDRFHETGLDEASIHGTGIMFVDSSFEKS